MRARQSVELTKYVQYIFTNGSIVLAARYVLLAFCRVGIPAVVVLRELFRKSVKKNYQDGTFD